MFKFQNWIWGGDIGSCWSRGPGWDADSFHGTTGIPRPSWTQRFRSFLIGCWHHYTNHYDNFHLRPHFDSHLQKFDRIPTLFWFVIRQKIILETISDHEISWIWKKKDPTNSWLYTLVLRFHNLALKFGCQVMINHFESIFCFHFEINTFISFSLLFKKWSRKKKSSPHKPQNQECVPFLWTKNVRGWNKTIESSKDYNKKRFIIQSEPVW